MIVDMRIRWQKAAYNLVADKFHKGKIYFVTLDEH